MKKQQEKQFTSYLEAVKDLDLVLCNNITQHHELSDYIFRIEDFITDDLIEEVDENYYKTDKEREEAIRDKAYKKAYEFEIFQYYLTNINRDYAEFLSKRYGLKFAYCEDLDLFVLLVDHYGTKWNSVEVEVID